MIEKYFFVSGVIRTHGGCKNFDIMEETKEGQVCIAFVPFDGQVNPEYGFEPAQKDALHICNALNFWEKEHG